VAGGESLKQKRWWKINAELGSGKKRGGKRKYTPAALRARAKKAAPKEG